MRRKYIAIFLLFLGIFGTVLAVPFAMPLLSTKVSASDLSSKEQIMNRNNTGIILLDRNGQEFYRFYQARHLTPTPVSLIPPHVRNAIIAAEDKEFYSHPGYSLRAATASLIANLRKGEYAYGGSTITQQLVKNSFLSTEKTYIRKYKEILLAKEMEKTYSKDEILEMYLNSVYFGEGAFGIEEAAKAYFSKSISDLTISESALLAGLLSAPSSLSPISGDKERAIERQHAVLEEMFAGGHITKEEHDTALAEKLVFKPYIEPETQYKAPHFAYMVRRELIDKYGEETVARSGYIVKTSIDLSMQETAEKAVKEQVAKLAGNKVTNGSAVVIDPANGEIRAMVGSVDFNNEAFGKVNVATSLRQPGSSFKPIVYLSALEKGSITPASILKDAPTTFGTNYKPENYDKRYRGNVTIRQSLSNSLNVTTVAVQQKVGVPATLDLAKRLGISTLSSFSQNDLSVSLGSGETKLLEMTNAYATLANKGAHNPATSILHITDKNGDPVYEYTPQAKQVIDPGHVYLISSILSDKAARKPVFGDALTISKTAAVKTGTSQSYKDSLTMGYTPSLAIGVWVGNNDGTLMDNVAGSLGAAPIWKNLMEAYLRDKPDQEFSKPENVEKVLLCRGTEMKAPKAVTRPGGGIFEEFFVKGTEPTKECTGPRPSPSPTPSPETSGIGGADEPIIIEDGEVRGVSIPTPPIPTPQPTPDPTPKATPKPSPTPDAPPTPAPTQKPKPNQ